MSAETETRRVAAISSPSTTTDMNLDVLSLAAKSKLVGSLVYFDTKQDTTTVRTTGQITGVEMRNSWHERDTIKNVVKMRGEVNFVSGMLDTMTATFAPGAVFGRDSQEDQWKYEVLGTVPSAGTAVHRLDQKTLDELVLPQKRDSFYLGRAYGDDTLCLPMLVKHFGDPRTGGLGEAIHTGIFGKTGSGKTTLAKLLQVGYLRHLSQAVLAIDPVGEFSDEISGYEVGSSGLPFRGILKGLNRAARRYGITQIRLETYELFEDVLISLGLDKDLNIRGADNKIELAKAIVEIIKDDRSGLVLGDLRGADKLRYVLETIRGPEEEDEEEDGYLSQIYKGKESKDTLRKLINKIVKNPDHRIFGTWEFLAFLFEIGDGSRPSVGSLVRSVLDSKPGERPLVSIDLSIPGNRRDFNDLGDQFKSLQDANVERELFTHALQMKILYRIATELRSKSESIVADRMREGDKSNVNTLVIFEEAHRYVPPHIEAGEDDAKKLKAKIIEAVRETRKFGLGWFFVDQTFSGLDRQIHQQLRCIFVGYGLSMGEELSAVKELIGGDPRDVALYRSFKDPASFGNHSERKFPWLAFGPVSPMAANRPMFFNAFGGEEFVKWNNLPVDRTDTPIRLAQYVSKASRKRATNTKVTTIDDLEENFLD